MPIPGSAVVVLLELMPPPFAPAFGARRRPAESSSLAMVSSSLCRPCVRQTLCMRYACAWHRFRHVLHMNYVASALSSQRVAFEPCSLTGTSRSDDVLTSSVL